MEFNGGWKAVAIRFLSCYQYSEKWVKSIDAFTNSPPPLERFEQERDLFGFFLNGLSSMECLCYSFYWIGGILRTADFPEDPDTIKKIYPEEIKGKYSAIFPKAALTKELRRLIRNSCYKEWGYIRNIIVHRMAPGRGFSNTSDEAILLGVKINLDRETTQVRLNWLSERLSMIISAADDFLLHADLLSRL